MAQPSHREQLIKGAIRCLQSKGYAHTTARDIAAASGANLASIGYHFGSKEGLLNEAMIRLFARRNWRVGNSAFAAEDATPLERLRATFVAASQVFEAPRPLFISFVEAIAQAGRSQELREQLAAHYRDARRATGEAVRAMLGPAAERLEADPEVMASLLMALFDGLVLQWLLEPDAVPSGDELMTALVETMALALGENGIGARAEAGDGRTGRRSTRPRETRAIRA
jgi:AcrR family transcriptional regulator